MWFLPHLEKGRGKIVLFRKVGTEDGRGLNSLGDRWRATLLSALFLPYFHAQMDTRLYRLQRMLRLKQPAFRNREPLILRDHLALERTRLSNERTLMSYIRSSLYLLIGGIALIQIEGYGDLLYVGYLSLLLCVLFLVVGFFRFYRLRDQLDQYYRFGQQLESRKQATAAIDEPDGA